MRFLEDALRRIAPEELAKFPAADKSGPGTIGSRVNHVPMIESVRPRADLNVSDEISGNSRGPQNLYDNNHHNSSPASGNGTTDIPVTSSQIGPGEPLAHEVGLLSLTNSREFKYLGPSSGVPFARLIFSAIPQSQGLAANWVTSRGAESRGVPQAQPFPLDWTSDVDLQHFVDAYFETYHPLHPFIDEDAVLEHLETLYTKQTPALNPRGLPHLSEIESAISPMYSIQIFLIIALGARVLETRLSANFSSERYLATAQTRIQSLGLPLHDTTEGLQIMLLLTLSSFYFENGPNAWFLNSNMIASCLDLGFQRRWTESVPRASPDEYKRTIHRKNIRSAIFWSTYSIERNLSVVLGRPLTLRDEAIDVEFPGEGILSYRSPNEQNRGSMNLDKEHPGDSNFKRPRTGEAQYAAAQYSFRLDQIVAEIKLMLHRVVNLPERFPWPTNLSGWQKEAHANCDNILGEILTHLKWRSRRSTADITIRSLELKYHHNLMLLHRPSPAIPQPSIDSWNICYNSAVRTIMIYSDLHRFSKLTNSWLTAHTVFVSGITFVYCLWVQPQTKSQTTLEAFTSNAAACTALLRFLGKTWTVAADAVEKFDRLVQMTASAWKSGEGTSGAEPAGAPETYISQPSASQRVLRSVHGYDIAETTPTIRNMNSTSTTDQDATNEYSSDYGFEPMSFYTELGDTSSWFDLDWILSMNTGPSGEVISYPNP